MVNSLAVTLTPRRQRSLNGILRQARIGDKIEIKLGPAKETLKALKGPFDLCFIDADKESYSDYYDRTIDLVRQGGLIVLDNMLRGGMVLSPRDQDSWTIAALNDRIQKDQRVGERSASRSGRSHARLSALMRSSAAARYRSK